MPVSLPPSPPFSVSRQVGRGSIKIFALSVQNIYSVLHTGGKVDLHTQALLCSLYIHQAEGMMDLYIQALACSVLSSSYRGKEEPTYSRSSMLFTQSLIQGDRWTSMLKLKYVLYSVPHTVGQVDLHNQVQVCLLSPSYRGTGGPPYSSSGMFFTQSLIQGYILKRSYVLYTFITQRKWWTSIFKFPHALYQVPHKGGERILHTPDQVCFSRSPSYSGKWTSMLKLKYTCTLPYMFYTYCWVRTHTNRKADQWPLFTRLNTFQDSQVLEFSRGS